MILDPYYIHTCSNMRLEFYQHNQMGLEFVFNLSCGNYLQFCNHHTWYCSESKLFTDLYIIHMLTLHSSHILHDVGKYKYMVRIDTSFQKSSPWAKFAIANNFSKSLFLMSLTVFFFMLCPLPTTYSL